MNGRKIGTLVMIPEKNMPNIIEVTDLSMPGAAVFAGLTDSELRKKKEADESLFIAESPNVITRALNAGYVPVSFMMERRHITGDARALIERCPAVPVYTGAGDVLGKITGFELTRGVLCAMRRPELAPVESVCASARRIAVLEDITESTNVGAIFRSAAALGFDAVLVTPACCDPLCRRSVRVSMGTVFQVSWTRIGNNRADWPHPGIDVLSSLGFKTAAMALRSDSVNVDDPALAAEQKLAVVLGTEGTGLLPQTIDSCNYVVCIPMAHGVDSLNVAAAAAVAFWQLAEPEK